MPFETPITIRDTIQRIQQREYLLPGIQREFVWQPDQICRLFDSLVRGYPIGSFLFWRVNEEHKADYQFYEFIRDYHEQGARHNPKASLLPAGGLTAAGVRLSLRRARISSRRAPASVPRAKATFDCRRSTRARTSTKQSAGSARRSGKLIE
jgi:hypothetical protein